ncbi:hypothetical protein D6C92_06577, partial [Aureobasidium pullulans]
PTARSTVTNHLESCITHCKPSVICTFTVLDLTNRHLAVAIVAQRSLGRPDCRHICEDALLAVSKIQMRYYRISALIQNLEPICSRRRHDFCLYAGTLDPYMYFEHLVASTTCLSDNVFLTRSSFDPAYRVRSFEIEHCETHYHHLVLVEPAEPLRSCVQ